jgi:hypothetical protein
MTDSQLLLSLFYGFQYMKQCLSVSFASKDGWVLAFSDRHVGYCLLGRLSHTHTHTHIHILYIYRRTKLYAHMGVTREFVTSMRH